MKIDFSEVLLDFDGGPIKDQAGVEVKLGVIAFNALMGAQSQGQSAAKIVEDGALALDVYTAQKSGEFLDLSSEQIAQIKTQIAAFTNPGFGRLVSVQALLLLEGKPQFSAEPRAATNGADDGEHAVEH